MIIPLPFEKDPSSLFSLKRSVNLSAQNPIVLVNDLSGGGISSLSVSLPVYAGFGVPYMTLPTGIFSFHTAFSSFHKIDLTDFWRETQKDFENNGLSPSLYATGFFLSADQIQAFQDLFSSSAQKALLCVDPVLGDHGKLYPSLTESMVQKMRLLIQSAEIIFPNLTEAGFLLGKSWDEISSSVNIPSDLPKILDALGNLGPKIVVLSGVQEGEQVSTWLYNRLSGEKWVVRTPFFSQGHWHGSGDLLSALFLGGILGEGWEPQKSLEIAVHLLWRSFEGILRRQENQDSFPAFSFSGLFWRDFYSLLESVKTSFSQEEEKSVLPLSKVLYPALCISSPSS